MQAKADSPRLSQQALLTTVMFALLLLSVGAAWMLVRGRGSPTRAAMNVIEQIRADGLDAHWQAQTVRWYLMRANGRPVGWRLLLRARRDDGGFEGIDFIVTGNAPRRDVNWSHWSHWSLNAHATKGVYVARSLSRRKFGPTFVFSNDKTDVTFDNGRIVIHQELKSRLFTSAAGAPPTYLPEGLLTLAQSLVARNKSQATFKITIDSQPPSGTAPYFASVNIRHASPGGVPGASLAVRIERGGTDDADMLYLDDQGDVVRAVTKTMVMDIATFDEVRAIFRETANSNYILRRTRVYKKAARLAAKLLPRKSKDTEDEPD